MALADNKTHGTTAASNQYSYTGEKLLNLYSPIWDRPESCRPERISPALPRGSIAPQTVCYSESICTPAYSNGRFTDNTMEIYKPAIYNSGYEAGQSYFKKQSAGRKSTNKQLRQNCRNAWMQPLSLTMRKKNGELEKALKKAKSPEEILTVFNSILIKE